MRVLAPACLLLLPLLACTQGHPRLTRLYDCSPSEDLDARARVDELDLDADGQLTAADLPVSGVIMVFTWLGPEGPLGTSVHTAGEWPLAYQPGADWDPVWNVSFPLDSCAQRATASLSFFGEDRNLTELQPGLGDLQDFRIRPGDYEMTSTWEGEASIRVTDVQDDLASGHLEGELRLEVIDALGMEPMDQAIRVDALAFRDLPIETDP